MKDTIVRRNEPSGLPRRWWVALSAVCCLAAIAGAAPTALGLGALVPRSGVRFGLLLAFLLTAPGTVTLALLGPERSTFDAALVPAIGLAAGAVIAQGLVLVHVWHPATVLMVWPAACLAGLWFSERHGPGDRREPV